MTNNHCIYQVPASKSRKKTTQKAIKTKQQQAPLLAHSEHWQTEPHPETAELTRLTEAEQSLYNDLRENRLGDGLRLEQEKIGFETLLDSLKTLP
ncbi:MAG: hypothetical protein JW764_05070 [Chlorobiaceae bacterium]|nr:hypothetical protein [Chlorobiaceae bacterium]